MPGNLITATGSVTSTATTELNLADNSASESTTFFNPFRGSAELGTDEAGKKALLIRATDEDDVVTVDPLSFRGKTFVSVRINNRLMGDFEASKFDRIVMDLGNGHDHTGISNRVTKDAFIFAGEGDDDIDAGGGRDVVIGGGGDDLLEGRKGRDLLIGGDGLDTLFGHEDDDLLVAAETVYDNDFLALAALQKEWISSNSYSKRVSNLKSGSGSNLGGHRLNDLNVLDDAFADILTGNSNTDAFFVQTSSTGGAVKDILTDKSSGETVTDVQ